jgi:Protein of unknown function, DUF481
MRVASRGRIWTFNPERPERVPLGANSPDPRHPQMNLRFSSRSVTMAALMVALSPNAGSGQEVESPEDSGALRVFFECSRVRDACDSREFRTQIDWVNWVRDRKDAQVHVIITGEGTGSGGRQLRLDFIGLEALAGEDDHLSYTSLGTDVRDETVRGMTRVLAVGLARYALLAGVGSGLEVARSGGAPMTDRLVTSDQVDDPWDFWVFRVDLSTNLSGETSRQNRSVRGGVEASRTTTKWKLNVEADGRWRRNEIRLSDTTIVDTRRDWSVQSDAVYALAEHWSLGAEVEASAATRTNQDLSVTAGPALEYSVWPYEESPRRSLRLRYNVGVRYFNYEEQTIFGFLSEIRPAEELELSISQRQPWGSTFANLSASHFLHDVGKYRINGGGRLSFRIRRGLNLQVNGRASWIRDQLFLAAQGVSDEEILLQRRRLASSFDWNFGLGFTFQFGSIFNNVVNNRF